MTFYAILTLAIAVGPIAWLLRARIAGGRQWCAASAAAVAMSGSALVVGPWALLSVYLRPIVVVSLIAALVVAAYRASRAAADRQAQRPLVRQWSTACLFGLVLFDGLAGWAAPGQATDLRFPLKGGTSAVLQGGNSLMTNPFHHWFSFDHYGLDLVMVNGFGNRARGIAPRRLSDYVSYDVAVQSPCTGNRRGGGERSSRQLPGFDGSGASVRQSPRDPLWGVAGSAGPFPSREPCSHTGGFGPCRAAGRTDRQLREHQRAASSHQRRPRTRRSPGSTPLACPSRLTVDFSPSTRLSADANDVGAGGVRAGGNRMDPPPRESGSARIGP